MCAQVRKLLLRLDSSRRHVRNWRPQLLLLLSLSSGSGGGGGANGAEALAETLNHIKKSGLLLLGHVVPTEPAGGGASRLSDATPRSLSRSYSARPSPSFGGGGDAWTVAARACQQRQRDLLDQIESSGWKAFPAVAMAGSLLSGVQSLVSGGAGLGSLAPNTVCFGFLKQGSAGWSDAEEYLTALRVCLFFGKSLLLARGFAAATLLHRSAAGPGGGGGGAAGETRQVDVWAFPGDGRGAVRRVVGSESEEEQGIEEDDEDLGRWRSSSTLSLALQLGYLYVEAARRGGGAWRLRLLTYVEDAEDEAAAQAWLDETLHTARIPPVRSPRPNASVSVARASKAAWERLNRHVEHRSTRRVGRWWCGSCRCRCSSSWSERTPRPSRPGSRAWAGCSARPRGGAAARCSGPSSRGSSAPCRTPSSRRRQSMARRCSCCRCRRHRRSARRPTARRVRTRAGWARCRS